MSFYLVKSPWWIKSLFPGRHWQVRNPESKSLYLTFDDGPTPEITPWVLDVLRKHQAKATFFCIGKNLVNHGDIAMQILNDGHSLANHAYHHNRNLRKNSNKFVDSVQKAQHEINKLSGEADKSPLFRPPYGRLPSKTARILKRLGFGIVMWDVLSADFDETKDGKICLNHVLKHAVSGSIIVFHDSFKAKNRLQYSLPKVLEYFSKEGYHFKSLDCLKHIAEPG